MQPHGILETCLYAVDLDAAESFYGQVLGLELLQRIGERMLVFKSGDAVFLVFNPELTKLGDTATAHGATGAGHTAFRIRREEFEPWRTRLTEHGVEIEDERSWAEGALSFYFRDPAGNSIELTNGATWGLPD